MIQIPVEPEITEYLHRKAAVLKTPLSCAFELTPVCNMECRMCYVRMNKRKQESIAPLRRAKEWFDIASEAKKQGLLYVLLTGGEPFMHPEFREILSGLQQMGFVISVNTNGTLINEDNIDWLRKAPPSRFNITLYGGSDETYERLCGKPDGFTRVSHAIRLLKEAGMTVKINVSLTPYNEKDLEEIFAFCKENDLLMQATSYMFPPLRRDVTCIGQNDRFTPEEAAYYSAKIESLLNGKEAFLKRFEAQEMSGLSSDLEENCSTDGKTEGDCMNCRAGKCSGWVNWEGKLMMCGMIPEDDAPNVFDAGFMNAWGRVIENAASVRLPVACSNCSIKNTCKPCAAMVYTESGCYSKVPEYRCQMAHAYNAEAGRLAEEIRLKIKEKRYEE